ncbi:MAG: class I SAM-dependent methyltransferase [Lachnospiraceae bacterium]|nr:class I SAM-dependent methyltransferase [Lachnospiraceae bacterium]
MENEKADTKDEQFFKLLDSIKNRMGGRPLKMLDYGAGKCRIWECMQLLPDADSRRSQLLYTAYEPYLEDDFYGAFKLYTDFSDICKEQQFHVIVLMNVLHEMEITQWKQTFQNIKSVLADDGILIFIEGLSLAKGE